MGGESAGGAAGEPFAQGGDNSSRTYFCRDAMGWLEVDLDWLEVALDWLEAAPE